MVIKLLILILLALAVLICYAALVAGTDASKLEEEYWREHVRKRARKEAADGKEET